MSAASFQSTGDLLIRVCSAEEVPEGDIYEVEQEGLPELAIYRVEGRYYATSNICTHNVALLSDGELEGTTVHCPLHGGAFDIRTGEAVAHPCKTALQTYEVVCSGEDVFVSLREEFGGAAERDVEEPPVAESEGAVGSCPEEAGKLVTVSKSQTAFAARAEDTILQAALRNGYGFPYECNSGGCGACACKLVAGEVADRYPDAPGLGQRAREKGYVLACQSVPQGDCVVDVALSDAFTPRHRPRRRTASLLAKTALTHDLVEFRFKAGDQAAFRPGQYAMLTLDGVTRAYSMSNLPNADGEWHFIIKRVPGGQLTGALHQLSVDVEGGVAPRVELDGPYGVAYLDEESERDILCVAGGAGISPMLAIVRGVAADPRFADRKIVLFYGGRGPRDLGAAQWLAEDPELASRVQLVEAVSSPGEDQAREALPLGAKAGFLHEVVDAELGGSVADYEVYISGPPPMLKAMQELLLVKHVVPQDRLHFDCFY